jgi:DNA primase
VCGSDSWKLYVNPETGMWYCHAAQHSGGGQVEVGAESNARSEGIQILRLLDGHQPQPAADEVQLPPFHKLTRTARRYLRKRGLGDDEIARLGLVEWEDKYRILIPYFDREGQLVYWNSRLYSDNLGTGPKYKAAPGRHPLYVPDRTRKTSKVVIVEGAFDAMAVARNTEHTAIALGGKSLPRYLRKSLRDEMNSAILLSGGGEIVVALDGDATGDIVRLIQTIVPPKGAVLRAAEFKRDEDPASVTPDRLNEVINGV